MPTFINTTAGVLMATDYRGYSVEVYPGDAVETYQALDNVDGWTRDGDAPYASLATIRQRVSAGDSISGLRGCRWIELEADTTGLIVTIDVAANPNGRELTAGKTVEIENNGEIETLHVLGTSGSVLVQGQP